MAPSPRPCTSLLLVSLFLVLLLSFSHAARDVAGSGSQAVQVQDVRHGEVGAGEEEAVSLSEREAAAAADDERCGGAGVGGGEEEECLMRRTLVAHTDYIYTQGGDHN